MMIQKIGSVALCVVVSFCLSVVLPTHAATFTVSTAQELIDAIDDANANDEVDIITLADDIALTAVESTTNGANGLPDITSDIIIDGAGFTIARSTTTGTPDFRIALITADGTLIVKDTTLSNGSADSGSRPISTIPENLGGALYNTGTLILDNSALTRNTAGQGGGGFLNAGTATLRNGSIIGGELGIDGNNTLAGSGGGIDTQDGSTLIIDASSVSGNEATGAQGAGILLSNSTLTIRNGSRIGGAGNLGNQGDNAGGGIAIRGSQSTVTIRNSRVEGNATSSILGGGGIYMLDGSLTVDNVVIMDNAATGSSSLAGGGILLQGGIADISDSTIIDNQGQGANGDAVSVISGDVTISRSTLGADNQGVLYAQSDSFVTGIDPDTFEFVYAVNESNVTIADSTIIAGAGGTGRGITAVVTARGDTVTGDVTLTNSTLAGFTNESSIVVDLEANSGLSPSDDSEGILNLDVRNVSIADTGTGFDVTTAVENVDYIARANIDVTNSFIEGPTGTDDCVITNNGTPPTSVDFSGNDNLSTGTNCALLSGVFTPTTGANLAVQSLADNGGATETVAIDASSVAVDAAGDSATSDDQRGVPVQGANRDIGAYETDATPVYPTVQFDPTRSAYSESAGTVTIPLTIAGASQFTGVAEFTVVDMFSGTAVPGTDYARFDPTTLRVDCSTADCVDGVTRTVALTINMDDQREPPETVLLEIATTNGFASIGDESVFTATIRILPPPPAEDVAVTPVPTPTSSPELAQVEELPTTGEPPLWRDWFGVLLLVVGVASWSGWVVYRQRR